MLGCGWEGVWWMWQCRRYMPARAVCVTTRVSVCECTRSGSGCGWRNTMSRAVINILSSVVGLLNTNISHSVSVIPVSIYLQRISLRIISQYCQSVASQWNHQTCLPFCVSPVCQSSLSVCMSCVSRGVRVCVCVWLYISQCVHVCVCVCVCRRVCRFEAAV